MTLKRKRLVALYFYKAADFSRARYGLIAFTP